MKTTLEDCNCLQYSDKIKIIDALNDEKNRLEKIILKPDISKGASLKFKHEIIPEYVDLIKRIENTKNCKV